ncbi:hypothetical protein KBX50_04695 [Micromonospora sp. C51]|uniref:hypothetical protein n=1 Tax=Micromonospora sp. C51 TaxID=2824879 RepID=UPI001B38532B|nr:hypothetical protein [Micromonospora sp. C51]MBQ1047787.1 hypothetical protein [Micromonospora sp. C51]
MSEVHEARPVCLIGYTPKGSMHYVRADSPDRGLCGVRLECVPFLQPADPFVHDACQVALAAALAGEGEAAALIRPLSGECPHCGGSVDVDQYGLVLDHRKAIIRAGILQLADDWCSGSGLPAEDTT